MKAIRIARFGGPDVLEVADMPIPQPAADEVLIRVAAAGVNFAETLMRQDHYVASYALPAIPGSEVAGTIDAVGADVADLEPGQRVGAALAASGKLHGGYAQFVTAKAWAVAPLPDRLDFADATALLVQGATASYLVRSAAVRDRSVLVTAAGGGVGSLLVQLARHHGAARIVAVASSQAKRDLAAANGADVAIDYADIAAASFDIACDSVGGEILTACLDAVSPGGALFAYGAPCLAPLTLGAAAMRKLVLGNVSLRGFAFARHVDRDTLRTDLQSLFALCVDGCLRITTTCFALDDAAAAHRAIEERGTLGKVVLLNG